MKDNGEPAFPHSRLGSDADGMTLRDYFAAKAMQGLMAMERASEFVDDEGYESEDRGTLFVHTDFLAKEAYMIADAMLKARQP